MASIYDFKPRFQQLLSPTLEFLNKKSITPNKVTITALIGLVLTGFLVLMARQNFELLFVLPIWLFLRMALNAIDGMMARKYSLITPLGSILNELGDVLSDLVLYLPLVMIDQTAVPFIVAFCIGATLTEFCGILGPFIGVSRHYEGPMGKSDRAFWVGALILATIFFPNIISYWCWFFLTGAVLTLWTSWNRVVRILKEKQEGCI